jgi:prevent-host-death family protein
MKPITNIETLTRFKKETSFFLKYLKETKQPVTLTIKGKPEIVVQDLEAYEELMNTIDSMKKASKV